MVVSLVPDEFQIPFRSGQLERIPRVSTIERVRCIDYLIELLIQWSVK